MPAATYEFTGQNTLGYPDYADLGTGRMLVADPGGSYSIRAIDGKAAVPPGDGRWATAGSGGTGGAPPPPPPVPPVPSVPEAEGSEG